MTVAKPTEDTSLRLLKVADRAKRDPQRRICERPGVRFPRATHLVIGFERENDARRVMAVLSKRFAADAGEPSG